MQKRLFLIIVTAVGLNFLGQFKCSVADTIYVYGLVNPFTGKIDGKTEVALKKDLQDRVGNKHSIIFDDNREEQKLKGKEVLLRTGGHRADWIVFFGHGSSAEGYIYDDYHDSDPFKYNYKFYPLKDLMYKEKWSDIKGVLIFGCAVLDIGDFGWQRSVSGDYICDTTNKGDYGNYCPRNPDPGLKWEELARRNNIKYLLGFNYFAPKLEKGGDKIVKKFFSNWMALEDKDKDDKNFLEAWRQELVIRDDRDNLGEIIDNEGARTIERAYIKKGNGNDYYYSMGRANNFDNKKELYWPESWQFAWEENYYLPTWIEKKSNGDFKPSMSVDHYYIEKYPKCHFDDVKKKNAPILYYNLRNLCTREVISGDRNNFYPTVDASLAAVSKMIVKAAGIKREPIKENFDCKKKENGRFKFGCDYIDDLVKNEIIEGKNFFDFNFDPESTVDRGYFMKILMNAFFKGPPNKEYNCPSVITDKNFFGKEKTKQWYCQYFLAADNCGILKDDLLKIDGKISPKINIKRGEAAILIDRARILKETGIEKCLSK